MRIGSPFFFSLFLVVVLLLLFVVLFYYSQLFLLLIVISNYLIYFLLLLFGGTYSNVTYPTVSLGLGAYRLRFGITTSNDSIKGLCTLGK